MRCVWHTKVPAFRSVYPDIIAEQVGKLQGSPPGAAIAALWQDHLRTNLAADLNLVDALRPSAPPDLQGTGTGRKEKEKRKKEKKKEEEEEREEEKEGKERVSVIIN